MTLGQQLVTSVTAARWECIFVAPYIKRSSLIRLLDARKFAVETKIVTRWRLDELALGVSDLSIWEEVAARPNIRLFLSTNLHAKYYRADNDIWVGSANLTGAALGWSKTPNLEILVSLPPGSIELASFETELFANVVAVDESLYRSFVDALDAYPKPPTPPSNLDTEGTSQPLAAWRPSLRFPGDLFTYYRGGIDELTQAARESASIDLGVLAPPPGLDTVAFQLWIAQQLRQHPEVQAIVEFASESRRFGEMRYFLSSRGSSDGSRDWQSWMRWFELFVPDLLNFHTANYSEIVQRR